MNYKKVYDALIASAVSKCRSKCSTLYFEEHHILPRCLGGNDAPENLVLLTLREHFIAHVLLWKSNPIRKLRDPVLLFKKNGQISTSRLYEMARRSHIDEMRNNNPSLTLSDAARLFKSEKLSAYAKNRKSSHNENISKSKIGKQPRLNAILSDETKDRISTSLETYYSENKVSDKTKHSISDSLFDYYKHNIVSDEIKQHLTMKALVRTKWKCPFCQKDYDGGNLTQHMRRKHDWSDDQINQLKETK